MGRKTIILIDVTTLEFKAEKIIFLHFLKTSANLLLRPLTKYLPLTLLRTFNMIYVSLSAYRLRGNFESCLAGLKKVTDSGNILTPVGRTTKRSSSLYGEIIYH